MKDTQAIFSAMLESKKAKSRTVRKVESTKRLKKESEEVDSEFTGNLVKAQAEDDNVMGDVLDNIQVVTDPEKTVDELEVRADEIQDAIEDSPEGEAAFSDEYVGDKVYACPVCGESFFAEDDYHEGDACPICKAEPTDGFLLQGIVAPAEAEEPEAEDAEDPDDSEEPAAAEDAESGEEEELPEGFDEIEEPEKEESVKKTKAARAKRAESRRARRKTECDNCGIEVTIDFDDNEVGIAKPAELDVELDEKSFEDNLNQFAAENYGDAIDNVDVVGATYAPDADELSLECVAECKNGKKVPMTFKLKENKVRGNRALLLARESRNALKVESKAPAFAFQVVNTNGTIKCESLKYSYTTTHSKAGRVKVEGYCKTRKRSRRV